MRILAVLVLTPLLGCFGDDSVPDPVDVDGKITMQNEPVADAVVGFHALSEGLPAEYRYAQTTTDEDGQYSVDNLYPAEYMVTVFVENKTGNGKPEEAAANPGDPAFQQYAADSPLRAKVSKDETHFDFDLEPPRRRRRR